MRGSDVCCNVKCCNCHGIVCTYGWCGMPGIAWCVCMCAIGKMGMTILKSIVVPFLPCLVAFLAFHPYIFFHLNIYFLIIGQQK